MFLHWAHVVTVSRARAVWAGLTEKSQYRASKQLKNGSVVNKDSMSLELAVEQIIQVLSVTFCINCLWKTRVFFMSSPACSKRGVALYDKLMRHRPQAVLRIAIRRSMSTMSLYWSDIAVPTAFKAQILLYLFTVRTALPGKGFHCPYCAGSCKHDLRCGSDSSERLTAPSGLERLFYMAQLMGSYLWLNLKLRKDEVPGSLAYGYMLPEQRSPCQDSKSPMHVWPAVDEAALLCIPHFVSWRICSSLICTASCFLLVHIEQAGIARMGGDLMCWRWPSICVWISATIWNRDIPCYKAHLSTR